MEWIIARWVTFVGTLIAIGACAVGLAILPRAASDAATRSATARDAARLGIGACIALIPAALMRLADQAMALQAPGDPWIGGIGILLTATTWGTGFLWQSAATLLALAAFALVMRAPTAQHWWLLATLAAVGLCVTPSLQGHAIGTETYTALAVASDITHVTGAGLWLGGIAVIGWLGFALPASDGTVAPHSTETADARLRSLVPLVPPVALTGAGLLVASGVASSVIHLNDVRELWSETWGRYVLVKTVLVLAIIALGARNWRRLGPRIAAADGAAALRRSLLIELLVALLVLLVTALLVVTPLPGES
ncbi:MAG TPA: CopD family protein [Gemmatimonadaceae bacterium]|nr:CopD family protein [Gemmatimonadaceae bacterium]